MTDAEIRTDEKVDLFSCLLGSKVSLSNKSADYSEVAGEGKERLQGYGMSPNLHERSNSDIFLNDFDVENELMTGNWRNYKKY